MHIYGFIEWHLLTWFTYLDKPRIYWCIAWYFDWTSKDDCAYFNNVMWLLGAGYEIPHIGESFELHIYEVHIYGFIEWHLLIFVSRTFDGISVALLQVVYHPMKFYVFVLCCLGYTSKISWIPVTDTPIKVRCYLYIYILISSWYITLLLPTSVNARKAEEGNVDAGL